MKRLGRYTIEFDENIAVTGYGSTACKKEAEGPLGGNFDKIIYDYYASMKTYEQAESVFQQEAFEFALKRSGKTAQDIDIIFAGDLLNQCISSSYGLKVFGIPYFGIYGACSTMAEGLILSAISLSSGASRCSACATSSHFCSAERQYRFPLDYGGQRTPTSQWTVTGSGSCILEKANGKIKLSRALAGRIVDYNIFDLNNMGAAMAPAISKTQAASMFSRLYYKKGGFCYKLRRRP